jgi:hypothetical protein
MSYEKDPVVEEIRETRRKIFSEFGNDPYKFGKFLAERERKRKSRVSRTRKTAAKTK